ncbi:hypothetical protein POV26_08580 [Aequorivita todarodis]|uniref:hypothetical protein n=1 Tax=Aequorivita todarodis TaxID=2036821 RepID=UPI0023507F48|nr:hypothetical protein [Aequorivita todarodis]MDC8001090.1 hypothetical protein [Aequorivita todarodis]
MRIFAVLFFLLCLVFNAHAQKNTLPVGEYFTNLNGSTFHLTITENDEFQIAMAKGHLIKTDSLVKLDLKQVETPTFGLRYLERDRALDTLTITFNKKTKKYLLYYILVGAQENPADKVVYNSAEKLTGDTFYDSYDNFEIKIPKTKYLHLLENRDSKDANSLYIFKIPEDVSKIEVNYEPSDMKDLQLFGEFNANDQTIILYEGKDNPLVFHIDYEKYISTFEKPYKIEENVPWKENDDIAEQYPYSYDNPYKFKVETFESLDEAVKKAGEDQKPLVTFYLAENPSNTDEYKKFIKEYETSVSYLMYDKYIEMYDNLYFYLLTEKDKKFAKKKGLEENTLLIIDSNKDMLYKQNVDFKKLLEIFNNELYSQSGIKNIYLMKRLDDAVNQKSFNAKSTQQLFNEISQISSYNFFSGFGETNKESYIEKGYIENGAEFHRLQSSPGQVNDLYSKLVASHKDDTEVDLQFANIAARFLENNYERTLYQNFDPVLTEADLLAIDYLIRFKEPLKNYEATTDEEYDKGYYFYNLFPYTISDALNSYAPNADAEMLQKMKLRYQKLDEGGADYFNFLQRHLPKEFLANYEVFYNANFANTNNIILQLNSLYETQNSKQSWSGFKGSIANQANEAAWYVVENISDLPTLKEAIKWSKTSLDIYENNPYFLDTYAQLLYKSGDKTEGIKFQEKAVNIIKNDTKLFGETLLNQTEDVLQRMKNNTY